MSAIEQRRAALYAELDRLERLEALTVRFGVSDDYEDGAVITFDRTFHGGSTVYSYAAIKAAERWYLTGKTSRPLLWSELVEQHLVRATRVDLVTDVEAL